LMTLCDALLVAWVAIVSYYANGLSSIGDVAAPPYKWAKGGSGSQSVGEGRWEKVETEKEEDEEEA